MANNCNILFIFFFVFEKLTFQPRWSILYGIGRYGWNFLYQCLGQNRNMAVSFRSKYWVIPERTGYSEKNARYRPENENRLVKCKSTKNRKKRKRKIPRSLLSLPLFWERRTFADHHPSPFCLWFFFFFIFRPELLHFCSLLTD
ncbi:hypothetical protein ACB092_12G059500 [Castanea dentata]